MPDRYLQLIGQPQIFGTQYSLDLNNPHLMINGGHYTGSMQTPFDEWLAATNLQMKQENKTRVIPVTSIQYKLSATSVETAP